MQYQDISNKLKAVLVPISKGFEEIETICVLDVLRRGGAKVTLACADPCVDSQMEKCPIVEGTNGIKVVCDDYLSDNILNNDYDLIVLPGGSPNAENLGKCDRLVKRIKKQKEEKKLLAAICAAPTEVLQKNGLLEGEKATCYYKCADKMKDQSQLNQKVVVSNNIITSQGPGTSIEFGLVLLEQLYDQKTSECVAQKLMAAYKTEAKK